MRPRSGFGPKGEKPTGRPIAARPVLGWGMTAPRIAGTVPSPAPTPRSPCAAFPSRLRVARRLPAAVDRFRSGARGHARVQPVARHRARPRSIARGLAAVADHSCAHTRPRAHATRGLCVLVAGGCHALRPGDRSAPAQHNNVPPQHKNPQSCCHHPRRKLMLRHRSRTCARIQPHIEQKTAPSAEVCLCVLHRKRTHRSPPRPFPADRPQAT